MERPDAEPRLASEAAPRHPGTRRPAPRPDPAAAPLPSAPPFRLRARILTPLPGGATRFLPDGLLEVDAAGRITSVSPWQAPDGTVEPGQAVGPDTAPIHDLRPLLLLPGLVDLHTHVPQLPNAGIGAGLDLLTWLERYTLPLERSFDVPTAERLAPLAFRAYAAAGTTTVAAYATADPAATEAVFAAAEAHGIRAAIGLVLMDRGVGSTEIDRWPSGTEQLDASAALCARWHGRDGGRLRYAVTPRFAVSCSADLLRASVRLAGETGALWQTHLSEDPRELAEVRRAFPGAADYLAVYEAAGALGPRALFAHAIHLSAGEVARLAASGSGIAHCPASNLFLPSGVMPLASYLAAGLKVGLGSDVSGGPSPSLFETMRAGFYAGHALQSLAPGGPPPIVDPLAWLRLATLDGAGAIGLADLVGSLEAGKEADLVAVDPRPTEPVPGASCRDDPAELVSRLIFRTHPEMVRAAWVRGRLLPTGPSSRGPVSPLPAIRSDRDPARSRR